MQAFVLRRVSGYLLRRHFTAASKDVLRFCVVGSGPSGFYTVEKLLKRFGDHVEVDVVEQLPTPFGLVRSGVAPDHADTKNVINQYTQTAQSSNVAFFGNVTVGIDVSLHELRKMYHGVVLAYGAEADRVLGIPGEGSQGVFSAREFVRWYNGHPLSQHLPVDLSRVSSVAVCGLGNVAVDCARVLLKSAEDIGKTDIASHAMQQLVNSKVEEVHLIGRRGPGQAAFTAKELRELLGLPGVRVVIDKKQLEPSEADKKEMAAVRLKRRIHEILTKACDEGAAKENTARTLHLHFFRNPVEIIPDHTGAVAALKLERTRLEAAVSGGTARAVGSGQYDTLPVQMLLKSIGYKSTPLEGVPFHDRRGIVKNQHGRVVLGDGDKGFDFGLYVTGWLKRGPSGIIGTNIPDAHETVSCIAEDVAQLMGDGGPKPGRQQLTQLLRSKGVQVVTFQDWLKLDAFEIAQGQAKGKPREKVVEVQRMLEVCAQ